MKKRRRRREPRKKKAEQRKPTIGVSSLNPQIKGFFMEAIPRHFPLAPTMTEFLTKIIYEAVVAYGDYTDAEAEATGLDLYIGGGPQYCRKIIDTFEARYPAAERELRAQAQAAKRLVETRRKVDSALQVDVLGGKPR